MELKEVINNRRSVRGFIDKPVSEETLERILDAGRMAPTGGNMQPWEFIVIRDRDRIARLVECTFVGYMAKKGNEQKWIKSAPLVVMVCVNYKQTTSRYGEEGKPIALMDTAAAIENMLLTVVDEGMASCWVSGFLEKEIAEVVNLPDGIEPVALLPIGYSDLSVKCPSKLELSDIVHREMYGEEYYPE